MYVCCFVYNISGRFFFVVSHKFLFPKFFKISFWFRVLIL